MRIATFNLESLDVPPRASISLAARAAVLRPALERLDADVLCLQEVNAQRAGGAKERRLVALDELLAGTRYAQFNRITSSNPAGRLADVHNLVTLSRYRVRANRQIHHDLVEPLSQKVIVGDQSEPRPVRFDRPMLVVDIELEDGTLITVINLHLRASLATAIAGKKAGPFSWRTVCGWAEGYYLSALKRAAQGLELRLLVEQLLQSRDSALIALAGDFNAEDHETPLRLAVAAVEDTGNGELAGHSLIVLDRAVPKDRRWSVLHAGSAQMLDHILVSQALYGKFVSIDVHNETLSDEVVGYEKAISAAGSYHAGVVATFDFK